MKKTLLFSLLTLTAKCALAVAPFSTDPAPVQAFHTVQSTAVSPVQSQPTVVPAQAAAPQQSVTAPAVQPAVTSAALESGAAIIHSNPPQTVVAQNVDDTAVRVQNLMQSNQAIGSAIRGINQNIAVLQEQVTALESAHHAQSGGSDWASQFTQNPNFIGFLSCGGIAVLLMMFGMMIGRTMMKKAEDVAVMSQKKVQADVLDDDTKTEYDFMSSSEAIPAKLDLARAYIAMNDEEQARLVLKTVIENGNHEQRGEALTLIQSMIHKK